MALNLVPTIGLRGLYELRTPWHNALQVNTAYSCIAVRCLRDIVADGKDPFEEIYRPRGLTNVDYNADVEEKASIVTLQADDGTVVKVPTTYISKLPNAGGIPYTVLTATLNLGAIMDSQDLTALKVRLSDVVKSTIGIADVETEIVAISNTSMIDKVQSEAIEAARQNNITQNYTDYSEVLELKQKNAVLQAEYDALVAWVTANCAIP